MEVWKTIDTNMWKPTMDGDNLSGVLMDKEPKTAELSARYKLENEYGQYLVWGSTILDDRMSFIKVGQKVRITYLGKTKNTKNQDLKLYKVEVAVENCTEPPQNDQRPKPKNADR